MFEIEAEAEAALAADNTDVTAGTSQPGSAIAPEVRTVSTQPDRRGAIAFFGVAGVAVLTFNGAMEPALTDAELVEKAARVVAARAQSESVEANKAARAEATRAEMAARDAKRKEQREAEIAANIQAIVKAKAKAEAVKQEMIDQQSNTINPAYFEHLDAVARSITPLS
eukprot:1132475-Prymnesium_polylepis.1